MYSLKCALSFVEEFLHLVCFSVRLPQSGTEQSVRVLCDLGSRFGTVKLGKCFWSMANNDADDQRLPAGFRWNGRCRPTSGVMSRKEPVADRCHRDTLSVLQHRAATQLEN